MKKVVILSVAIIIVPLAMVKAVPIGTADIKHIGYGAGDSLRVWGGGLHGAKVRGGVYMLDKTAGTGQGNFWPDGRLSVFRLELTQQAPKQTTTYDVVMPAEALYPPHFSGGPIGVQKADYLSELWGRFYDPAWVGSGSFTKQQGIRAAAFAAAIWEIVYENLPATPSGWNVKTDGTAGKGGFRAKSLDYKLANSWLYALDGTGPKADLRAFVNNRRQDYMRQVPEPVTVAMLGLGSLVLLGGTKRK